MKKYSALLGSTALAMVLFSGCSESDSSETAVAPTTVDKEALEVTAKSSLRSTSNTLLRAQAQSGSLPMADVVLTLALDNFNDDKSFGQVFDASATVARYLDGDDLAQWNSLTSDEQDKMFLAAYFGAEDYYGGGDNAPALRGFGSFFKKIEKTVKKVTDPINDKIIKPVIAKVDDKIIDPIQDKILEPINDKIIDPVAEKVQDKIFDPINEKVIDPINEKVIEPLLDGELVENIGDEIKSGVEKIVEIDLVTDLTAEAFKIVLESDGVTSVMLDMAIKSETITNIMITVMEEHWDLTNKMAPMLRDPNNIEFGEKFMELAKVRPQMARFLFTYIDANMYDALADAMVISSDAFKAGTLGHDEYTTATMGELMALYAVDYFIIPSNIPTAQGDNARFPSLMFNTGTTARGDGNELINEKFFYALFKTPGSTESFVEAMEKIPADKETYMDLFFTGANPLQSDTISGLDVNQSYNNIIAIAGGMYQGTTDYGIGAYTDAFLGFAGIVPENKYWTYGKSFMMAGYAWGEMNGYSPLTGAFGYISDWLSEDETETAPALRGFVYENDGRDSTQWAGFAYNVVETELLNRFVNWDTATLAWDALYDYVAGDENSTVTEDAYTSLENNLTLASTNIQESFRSELELELNEDIIGFNADRTANPNSIVLEELTLPAFSDMNVSYVYTEVKDRVVNYAEGIDSQWLANFSESNFSSEYIYPYFKVDLDNNESLAYVPNWMTQLDWLKLPFIYDNAAYNDYGLDFESGLVSIYIVSDYDNAAQYLSENTSLAWTQVDDAPLTTDESRILYTYTASINVYDLIDFNLNETITSVQDYVAGVAVDVGLAEDVSADNNTSN